MKISKLMFCAAFVVAPQVYSQSLTETIAATDRVSITSNQGMSGTWLLELRRGGQPATQPPVLAIMSYQSNGTVLGIAGDGTQSAHNGVWIRTGDRKFLQTMYLFSFNEARVVTTITKVRINTQLSADGLSLSGTQEIVVLDREGKVMATIPGGTHTGIRLNAERSGDYESFQTQP